MREWRFKGAERRRKNWSFYGVERPEGPKVKQPGRDTPWPDRDTVQSEAGGKGLGDEGRDRRHQH